MRKHHTHASYSTELAAHPFYNSVMDADKLDAIGAFGKWIYIINAMSSFYSLAIL